MTIKDEVFGEIEYEFGWSRVIIIDFFGNTTEVNLLIDGEEDGQFDEGQYIAYQSLMKNWNDIQKYILKSILTYYGQKRNELGFDIEVSKKYPLVETTNEILEMISIEGIVVPYADIFDGRDIGITFNCTWDTENGLGVRLLNEKVTEVGFQDVAI
ncbi:DUF2004 domain-containing protein [Priestia flexa]|jgi:Protein of unknown function (DUF2004)|uniref:DUF2004 domain-containing protein n=1 Tax=Priestia flexa TaxID=86664 RepID=A0ABU4J7B3_9BACI|nr:DUF2004 domain-containing protein [Priestia flexa]MDT2046692.1 DUF2004 domain-containing protein [Priestia flexa]MDW8516909.1 DUF2004 domain-containing protein [Priestia flexa]MEC0668420.1 DUF2004 domain-containing protein [Priestia flexa]MED3825752.1 DUF2004 domain-containing protein [Priestia flexa]UZW65321.1 DUF2004 domain-containing protein [Priestia flexa]